MFDDLLARKRATDEDELPPRGCSRRPTRTARSVRLPNCARRSGAAAPRRVAVAGEGRGRRAGAGAGRAVVQAGGDGLAFGEDAADVVRALRAAAALLAEDGEDDTVISVGRRRRT